MKLKCKIKDKYLQMILQGIKTKEYRQVESIIFVDEQGKEYEFEVISIIPAVTSHLMEDYPDIDWKYNLPSLQIELGKRIK